MNIHDVDSLSLWQFLARVDGYIDANTPEDKKKEVLSDDEFSALADFIEN